MVRDSIIGVFLQALSSFEIIIADDVSDKLTRTLIEKFERTRL